jgi:hypothetical protein
MTTFSVRQPTPFSLTEMTPEPESAAKKSKNRKPAKKPISHSSTLHSLWGKSKSTGERLEMSTDDSKIEVNENGADMTKSRRLLVAFKIPPPNLAAILGPPERMITPPRSLPDMTPETPVHLVQHANTAPNSPESGGKKRQYQQSPLQTVRRSPRNHRLSNEPAIEKPVTKPHPFFLGKAARM